MRAAARSHSRSHGPRGDVYTSNGAAGVAAPQRQCLHQHPAKTRRVDAGASGPGERAAQWLRSLADFGSWAPKASRAWRLGQSPNDPNAEPDAVDDLQARLQQQAQPASSSSSPSSSGNAAVADSPLGPSEAAAPLELPPTGSFSEADDSVLSQMLSKRIQSLSGSMEEEPAPAAADASVSGATATEDPQQQPDALSGEEMRRLILAKYGKTYDVSLVRRDGFGKSFVALNVTWQHLEQRSFRLTEEQYMEKISSVAYLLNLLGQSGKVRAFLQAPAKSERGLPRRPVVGTAISVQLDLPQNLIDEFFGNGYY